MHTIAVINQGHTDNLGDIAINKVITEKLKSDGINVIFFPFWDEKKVFGILSRFNLFLRIFLRFPILVDSLNIMRINKIVSKYKLDGAVIGGGELISSHKGFNSSIHCWSRVLKKQGVRLALYGVSGDAKMKNYLITRNIASLRRFDYICVRDEQTRNIFRTVYRLDAVDIYPDVVFSYADNSNVSNICSNDSRLAIFAPIPFSEKIRSNLNLLDEDQYKIYLRDMITNNTSSEHVVVFTTTVKDDDLFVKSIYNEFKLQLTSHNCIYKPYSDLNEYTSLLNNADVVISARMHAMILGLAFDCKIIPVEFKEKLVVFQREYGGKVDMTSIKNNSRNGLNKISEFFLNFK
jgi:polysaccharide pyruvyl transferase WcaK-like protein